MIAGHSGRRCGQPHAQEALGGDFGTVDPCKCNSACHIYKVAGVLPPAHPEALLTDLIRMSIETRKAS